ncbi:MAG: chorismate mutase [Ruminococcus sp.]|nr:chorismate mutase [Ruminococcus sp.]
MDLQQLRNGIDDIDSEILGLFMKRMAVCRDVAEYKRLHNMPVFQGGREQQIIDRIRALTGDPELEAGTAALFTSIMDISKILQNRKLLSDSPDYRFTVPDFAGAKRIGCQGTSGANSETAAKKLFGDIQPIFYKTFEDVFAAVQAGELDFGVLPVHNSTAGSVSSTYDLMAKYSVYTVSEVCVEINHCLAAKTDIAESEVTTVYSHPQAIAQCCDYLTAQGMKTSEYGNTATAAAMVAESAPSEKIAAICSVECAKKLGLHIIARDITDCALNRTRFVCISRELQVSEESDAISVMLKIPHTEGSLYRLLTKFYVNGMNLLRIESRPIKDGSFDVVFYLDFSGRIDDPSVKALMNDLAENLEYFRFLGTFKSE